MNFRYKLAQFMYGRYGLDPLFYILMGLVVVIAIANVFLSSVVIQLIIYAIEIYALFRIFSRNRAARERENRFALYHVDKFKQNRARRRAQRADDAHIYKKCPKCKAVLRLPKRKGKHRTVCPKCNHEFSVNVR